jgi:hypothetical protein
LAGSPGPCDTSETDRSADRRLVFRAALEGAVLGDVTRFHHYLTDDVQFTSPHLTVTSRAAAERAFGVPEVALSDVQLTITSLDEVGDKLSAEWQLHATFSGALMFDDDLLIEPTGGLVHLRGSSVADFRGSRIASFRHYFDDSEMLRDIPRVPDHVRWSSALLERAPS